MYGIIVANIVYSFMTYRFNLKINSTIKKLFNVKYMFTKNIFKHVTFVWKQI